MFKNICVEVCCTVDNKFFRVDLRLRQQKICCTYYHIEKWGFRIIELKKQCLWSCLKLGKNKKCLFDVNRSMFDENRRGWLHARVG